MGSQEINGGGIAKKGLRGGRNRRKITREQRRTKKELGDDQSKSWGEGHTSLYGGQTVDSGGIGPGG